MTYDFRAKAIEVADHDEDGYLFLEDIEAALRAAYAAGMRDAAEIAAAPRGYFEVTRMLERADEIERGK